MPQDMPTTDTQALEAHFKSIEASAQAEVCSAHIGGFAEKFEKLFRAWREANSEALSKGALLAEAKGWNRTDGSSLQSFARLEAQVLAEIPADDRQRRCDELLESFIESKAM